MKTGKFIPIEHYKNIKIGYGTIDFKNLKTIYIKLNAWLLPETIEDYDQIIFKTRREIKALISSANNENFKKESIVDLDIRTKGIKLEKKSFMNLEITLFVNNQFDIKKPDVKFFIKTLSADIIDKTLINKSLFNFHKKKQNA